MKELYSYICEAEGDGGFDKYVSTYEELIKKLPHLVQIEKLKSLIDWLISDANYKPEELFILSDIKKYFKFPYAYYDSLIKAKTFFPEFNIIHIGGRKIKVMYNKREIFELGAGSIGRVSTAAQESASVAVWNKFIETGIKDPDMDTVKEIVKDISSGFDSEWIKTFQKQVLVLIDYIENSLGEDSSSYKMTRYGEDHIGKAYKTFIQNYTSCVSEKQGQKDNYDPADVIIYKADSESKIHDNLIRYSKCNSIETAILNKDEYVRDLFNTKLVIGISLKKIAGNKAGHIEVFNNGINYINDVTGCTYKLGKDNNSIIVVCCGKFDLSNITDTDGDEGGKESRIKLTMRSFGPTKGGNQVAMDATLMSSKSPTLGKCPARFWMNLLGISQKESKNLQLCVKKFHDWLETHESDRNKYLTNLIKASIKEGTECFPFVLLH